MKKVISMIAALSMMLSAAAFTSVASAAETNPTLKVELVDVSDPTWAVGTTFFVQVSYDNVPTSAFNEETGEAVTLSALQFELDMSGYGTKYTKAGMALSYTDILKTATYNEASHNKDNIPTVKYFSYAWTGNQTYEGHTAGSGDVCKIKLKLLEAGEPSFSIRTTGFNIPPKVETLVWGPDAAFENVIKVGADTYISDTSIAGATGKLDVVNYNVSSGEEEPEEPTVSTVTTNGNFVDNAVANEAEGEFLDEESAAAVAYWAEGAFTQGKSSAYWTANFGTAAKKYVLGSLPNLDGNVKLGIVITGATDVSAVKLNVETTN